MFGEGSPLNCAVSTPGLKVYELDPELSRVCFCLRLFARFILDCLYSINSNLSI